MRFTRSFFFLLLSLAVALPALAADDMQESQASSKQAPTQALENGGSLQTNATPFGMPAVETNPFFYSTRPVVARRFTKLDDSACLKLRVYKVKRTERLAYGETGQRGYTTCTLASNYQYRSAVANQAAESADNTAK